MWIKKLFLNPDDNYANYFEELKSENSQCIYDCNKFPNYPLIQNSVNLYSVNKPETEKEPDCEIFSRKNNIYYEFNKLEKCLESCALFQINSNIWYFNRV